MNQQQALELLKLGNNVFLTGPAGSGKTYLLNRYIKYLRSHKVGIAVTATTGIAATHLNGRTIHSWSGLGVRDELTPADLAAMQRDKRLRRSYVKTKVLVIDEISMLAPHQLDLIDRIARHMLDPLQPFGGLQLIASGDFFQLPPVSTNQNNNIGQFAYESHAWLNGGMTTCYLSEQHRQGNDPLINVLNDIRNGCAGEQTKVPLRTRYKKEPEGSSAAARLFARNINVDKLNLQQLDALPTDERVYPMTTMGYSALVEALKRNCVAAPELRLRIGAQVMFIKNATDGSYVNGTLGVVEAFDNDDDLPIVRTFNNRKIIAEPEQWSFEENGKVQAQVSQVPLRLAWAVTVHKSQGMTLDAAEIDLSDAFEPGMGYVALSRVRSLSGLKLMGLNEMALRVHPKVLAQDICFKQDSETSVAKLQQLPALQLSQQQTDVLHTRFEAKKTPKEKKTKKPAHTTQNKDQARKMAYQPWTQEADDKLTSLYNNNVPVKELAEIFERGTGAIRSRIKKLGLAKT